MLFDAQPYISWYPCTPSRPAKRVIKWVISEVLAAVAGIVGFMRVLPYALKISMAPKTTRNPGEKLDGVKTTRVGRDKGDLVGANKRLTSIIGKRAGKNMPGSGKDAKSCDSATPLLEVKGKNKSQSTIMSFLAGGAQDSSPAHTTLSSEINPLGTETILLDTSSNKTVIECNKPLTKTIRGSEGLLGTGDSKGATREKELVPPAGSEQPQVQSQPQAQQPEYQTSEETANTSGSALDIEDMHKTPLSLKKWNKAIEKDLKSSDWVKDSSDKFYSLTEESDLSSGEHSFSESSSGNTSEAGNKSSSNEPTVRQLRRQRKCTKPRPCSQEYPENLTATGGRTLKWDYSGIRLTDSPTTNDQGPVNNNMEGNIGGTASNMCVGAPRLGFCSQYITQLKSFKQRLGLKVGVQESLQSDCRERSVRLQSHAQKLRLSYALWKKG
ncbi:hypothetical protein NDU88_002139 [Pleurodeles waltl]|uniref:Uncharacterized protein n=1 Tax=Pleurodeles waltl TaxID=8319 RepID=A0AAV7U9X6_PLEWA|nr:hypothetical protein NDU88_002139 [Pleurodeles waltl]